MIIKTQKLKERKGREIMSVNSFNELKSHLGHEVEVVSYGVEINSKKRIIMNVAIECENCKEVLLDFDNTDTTEANTKEN
jgi:hypothetical protein